MNIYFRVQQDRKFRGIYKSENSMAREQWFGEDRKFGVSPKFANALSPKQLHQTARKFAAVQTENPEPVP
jgi:hypothetical protein